MTKLAPKLPQGHGLDPVATPVVPHEPRINPAAARVLRLMRPMEAGQSVDDLIAAGATDPRNTIVSQLTYLASIGFVGCYHRADGMAWWLKGPARSWLRERSAKASAPEAP